MIFQRGSASMSNMEIPFQNKRRDKILPCLLIILEIVIAGIAVFLQNSKWLEIMAQSKNWDTLLEILNGNDLENFQEFVITCSTMTTAVVILCYSIFDSKRLGISNRTIIRYQIGNKTLPIAFFLSLVKLPVFKDCTYLGWKDFLLFELPYSLLIQFIIIGFVIRSSSMNVTIKMIAMQEGWQYKKILEYKWGKWEELENLSLWKISHIQQVMESEELFSDKLRLLKAIFEKGELKWYPQMRKRNAFYSFYYHSAYEAFCAVKDNGDERQLLYTFFYSEIGRFIDEAKDIISDKKAKCKAGNNEDRKMKIEYMVNLAVSAIMNAALFSGVEESEIFCTYLLEEVCAEMDSKLRNRQIVYYLYTLELLYRTATIKAVNIEKLCEFLKEEPLECMDMRYYEYWEFITRKCTLDRDFSEMVYYEAGLTLMEKRHASVLMLYIVQLMKGERKG